MWRTRNARALLVGLSNGAAAVENSSVVLQMSSIELPCGPAVSLLGIYKKKKLKTGTQASPSTLVSIAVLFTAGKG